MQTKRLIHFRKRYWTTRTGHIRLRVSAMVFTAMAAMTMLYLTPHLAAHEGPQQTASITTTALNDVAPAAAPSIHEEDTVQTAHLGQKIKNIFDALPDTKPEPELPPFKDTLVKVKSGDTLSGALNRTGMSAKDVYSATQALKDVYDPRDLRPGQVIKSSYWTKLNDFSHFTLDISPIKTVKVHKTTSNEFIAEILEKPVITRTKTGRTTIETSLFGSALRDGLSQPLVAEAMRIYAWDIDFQRDIRSGDTLEVLYEQDETEDGTRVSTPRILFSKLVSAGNEMVLYQYEMKDGRVDYFDETGQSARRALMKTPVDGARMSSGYGMRHHPVLGYNKMHKGVDFAAPQGTPIYAAGDGIIEKAGWNGGYGKYIRIRHNGQLKTAYAHMKGFAKGISSGKRVQQGDVIGYIGTTGRSTGPHLHYEVLVGNTQTNPKSLKLPTGEKLENSELQSFKAAMSKYNRQYASLKNKSDDSKLAQAQ